MKKVIFSIVSIFTLLVLASCGTAEDAKKDGGTIKIGGLAPLTGEVAVYGKTTTNGIKLAIEEANKSGGVLGQQIEFLLEDEKGDPTEAVNAYNKLVNNKEIVALIGDITSKPSVAVAKASTKEGIPVITPTATAENVTQQGKNVFRACFLDPFQGSSMAQFAAKNLNAKTAAIVYNTGDDYSAQIAAAFKKAFEKSGGKVVANEGYGADDKDFRAQLSKVQTGTPDVLFIPDYYTKVALITTQAKELGITATLLGSDGWDGVLEAIQSPDLLDGSYYSNHYSPEDTAAEVQDFITNYKAKFNEEPNSLSALGYDAANLLIAAIKKADSTEKDKVIKALNDTKDFSGVTGKINFDENRNPVKSVTVLTFKDGKTKFFDKVDPE